MDKVLICSSCGSASVTRQKKSAQCNNCGVIKPIAHFRRHVLGTGEHKRYGTPHLAEELQRSPRTRLSGKDNISVDVYIKDRSK